MMYFRVTLLLSAVLTIAPPFAIGGGPENAIVVINAESDSSKLIANHYIAKRKIPCGNVVYLDKLPNSEFITLARCKRLILQPIVEHIRLNKLNRQIDNIIYSVDFPSKITIKEAANDFFTRKLSNGSGANKKFHSATASLTSVTYFLHQVMNGDTDFIALDANNYMRRRNTSILQDVFNGAEQVFFKNAVRKIELKKFKEANSLLLELLERHPRQPALYYWGARNAAGSGDTDKCIEFLKQAASLGFNWRKFVAEDRAFVKLRDESAFKSFVDSLPTNSVVYLPTRHFDSNYIWGRNGFVNGSKEQGNSYVLSTMLGVSRNGGNSEIELIDQLDQSIGADSTHPKGTFYFSDTKDVRSRTRRRNFDHAISELQRLGFTTSMVTTTLPKGVNDIAGLMTGTPKFDFGKSRSKILPGSICDNLTSYGGRFDLGAKQTQMSEFIRFGAAGSCGTVVEPYALQAKFPHPNMHVHYVKGCTLAESFYQSVAGPFQLLILGDALCQPYATSPKFELENETAYSRPLSGNISFNLVDTGHVVPIEQYELYVDGVLAAENAGNTLNLDTHLLSDGYHEIRLVAVANNVGRNRSRKILRVNIDNSGRKCRASIKSASCNWHDVVAISIEANINGNVQLKQNNRIVAAGNLKNGKAELPVDARLLGRGPNYITAMAQDGGQAISSDPIFIQVSGPVYKSAPRRAVRGILHPENANHLLVVRNEQGQWQLCSNFETENVWYDFTPRPDDQLIAVVDLTKDSARLINQTSKYAGIDTGIRGSDIRILPNRFLGRPNENEFEIKGTFFFDENGKRVTIGPTCGGLAVADKSMGRAFIMYSEERVRTRFADLRPRKP